MELRDVNCDKGSHSYLQSDSSDHAMFNPSQASYTQFTYPRGIEGWVDLGGLLHTEMVYTPGDGHPSKY